MVVWLPYSMWGSHATRAPRAQLLPVPSGQRAHVRGAQGSSRTSDCGGWLGMSYDLVCPRLVRRRSRHLGSVLLLLAVAPVSGPRVRPQHPNCLGHEAIGRSWRSRAMEGTATPRSRGHHARRHCPRRAGQVISHRSMASSEHFPPKASWMFTQAAARSTFNGTLANRRTNRPARSYSRSERPAQAPGTTPWRWACGLGLARRPSAPSPTPRREVARSVRSGRDWAASLARQSRPRSPDPAGTHQRPVLTNGR